MLRRFSTTKCAQTLPLPTRWTLIPALLKCSFRITAKRPIYRIPQRRPYPVEPKTLGDSLLKSRRDRGLRQIDVAEQIGTTLASIRNWEGNRNDASFEFQRRVYDFIGMCPYDATLPLGGRLRERREYLGYSVKTVAKILGCDPCTVASWERGDHKPTISSVAKIEDFLQPK
jgi:transcriptional regulator with XRE-family HTH domain